MHKEIASRKDYLDDKKLDSIYFGGGTPSILSPAEINAFIDGILKYFQLSENAEITLEANPDDLTSAKLSAYRDTPVNRLSIGVQSFFNEDLLLMNRAHNANEADSCIKMAQDAGFHDISIDLIYALPSSGEERWKQNLAKVAQLDVPHVSAYCLTIEPRTALSHFVDKGKVVELSDADAEKQFHLLLEWAEQHGYRAYEISNLAKPGHEAVHNSNYWKGVPYLGIGPSAHSFNGESRQWNVRNNARYIQTLESGRGDYFEIENLSTQDRLNEYLMTGLRTIWGCELSHIRTQFGKEAEQYVLAAAHPFLRKEMLYIANDRLLLSESSRFLADGVISELMWVDPRKG